LKHKNGQNWELNLQKLLLTCFKQEKTKQHNYNTDYGIWKKVEETNSHPT
jgi:hypothetical protein